MDLSVVQKRIEQLEKLQEENRISREMLKGELENELAYLEAAEEVKAAAQKRKVIKEEILNKGANQEVVANIKNNQEEIKTLRDILSAELAELYSEQKVDEIADASGETRKFKLLVKLLPKKAMYDKRNAFGQYAAE